MTLPLISAMCVTRGRPEFVRNAIDRFLAQTYPNKELILYSVENLMGYADDGIFVYRSHSPAPTIGAQRTECLKRTCGRYVAVWDDDDPHPADRLQYQYDTLQAAIKRKRYKVPARAVCQAREVLYDATTKRAYVSGKRAWENSFFCYREDLLAIGGYPDKQIEEDTYMVQNFMRRYGQLSVVQSLDEMHYIYVRQPLGTTSTEAQHVKRDLWKMMLSDSQPASAKLSQWVRDTTGYEVIE